MRLSTEPRTSSKLQHPIPKMFGRIRKAIEPYPKAMLFELRDHGFDSLFEQLVACMISIRTLDEVSLPVSLKLFAKARTPQKMAKLSTKEIYEAIRSSTYAHQKAERIAEIAKLASVKPLTPNFQHLTELPGIGPKCANLVLGIASGKPAIGVDVHVHRVTTRWGFVHASTPEKTLRQLEDKLPKRHWVEINELLVPFGKHICTGRLPKCSTCPVLENCEQAGVTKHL
jgi:endonuclease-3